jgi:lysophospholipase L1-like esterase
MTLRHILRIAVAAAVALGFVAALPVQTVRAQNFVGLYVALGDSYAAGPLIPDQVNQPCLRSDHNYPGLVALDLYITTFRDVSCSGATTDDFTQSQVGSGGVAVPPQFDALTPDTALISLTIGGNDIGFGSVVSTCAQLSATNPFGAPCEAAMTAGGTDRLAEAINATAPKIAAALRGIHQRAPHARVLVVGYMDILPAPGVASGCWPLVPIAVGDVSYLRGVELQLNQMLALQASQNGASFVDAYTPTIGHDVCQIPLVKWVEGVIPLSPAAPFHPNQVGMQNVAYAVIAQIH